MTLPAEVQTPKATNAFAAEIVGALLGNFDQSYTLGDVTYRIAYDEKLGCWYWSYEQPGYRTSKCYGRPDTQFKWRCARRACDWKGNHPVLRDANWACPECGSEAIPRKMTKRGAALDALHNILGGVWHYDTAPIDVEAEGFYNDAAPGICQGFLGYAECPVDGCGSTIKITDLADPGNCPHFAHENGDEALFVVKGNRP